MKSICDLISRYMGLIVLLTALITLLFPATLNWVSPLCINPLLGVVMFGMGLTLNFSDFKVVFSRPKDVIIGFLSQFTIMPLLALLLTKVFSLPSDLALGVILVGCCPGGTASNVITYLAKGDLALSVGITAMSTLFAPIMTPFLTWLMAGTFVDVDAMSMFLSIVQVVILPILIGFLIQKYFPTFTRRVVSYLPAFSSLVISLIVGIIVSNNSAKLLHSGLLIVMVVVLHNVLGLICGYSISRLFGLNFKKRIAISVEVGMQNSGLASSLATLHFAAYPMATIPGAVFSVWHNISGALVAHFFSKRQEEKKE